MNEKFEKRFFIALLISLTILAGTAKIYAQATPTQTGPTEELIPEEAQQQKWTQAFQAAEKVFNSEKQSDSIQLFQNLVADITAEKVKRQLSDSEKLLLLRSLDYLGQAFFLEEQQPESREVFLKLIEIEPNYKMNEDLVSPKIIDFVNKIKEENLGILSVTSDPPGATIKIDGNPAGTTNVTALYCLKGEHDLEVGKSGFFPKKETVSVTPGKTQRLNFKLDRSSSVAYFVTYPKGIELLMNGKSIGVTGGDTPSDRAQHVATEQNLPVADFSAEFPVADLQPGTYEIQFRKQCWESQVRKIEIPQNNDFYFEPIIFVPSHATLNITADDPKANIFIDNDYLGIAPKTQLQVCSGKHVLKIKGAQGKYQKELDLKKDQALSIDAKLNPALAFLGVMNGGSPDKDANADVIHQLSSLSTLNLQDSSNLEASTSEKVQQLLRNLKSIDPDKGRKAQIQELTGKTEADLLLIGDEKSSGTVDFYLVSGWSSVPDVRTIHTSSAEEWKKFNDDLNIERPLFEKRMGINLIDTSVNQGPVIARVSLKTTDAQALNAGDILVAVNNNPVKTASEAIAAAQNLQQAPQITLSVMRSGSKIDIPVKMISGPVEISFEDPRILYNRQMAAYKKISSLSINPLEKNIALLNTGLCFMHFGEYDDALDQFRQIENLNRPVGIGQGTVKFHMAACFEAQGNRTDADSNLTEASHFPQNTLRTDDGLPLTVEVDETKKSLH